MAEAYFVAKDISADRLTSEYSMAKKMLPEEIPDGLALVRIMKKAANKRKLIEECDKSATSSSSSVRQACFDNISYIIKQLCACDVKRLDE